MLKRIILALLACALLASAGCDSVKPYMKGTKRLYKEYINTDPTIDLKDPGISDPSVRKLADLFTPVDERLEYLLRILSAQDLPPDSEWIQGLMDAHPWLSGVAVLSDTGFVMTKLPRFTIKQVDFTPLVEMEAHYKSRRMACYVDASEFGAEVMVAKPLFVDNDYKGLIIAHFDAGSLAKFAPEPGQIIILAPGTVLWAGDDSGAAQSLARLDWKKLLKSEVSGETHLGGQRYLWQARYVAQARLVYAVQAAAKGAKTPAPAPAGAAQPAPAENPAQKPVQ